MEEKVIFMLAGPEFTLSCTSYLKHDIFPNRRNLREKYDLWGRGTQLFKMTVFKQVEVVSVDTSLTWILILLGKKTGQLLLLVQSCHRGYFQ